MPKAYLIYNPYAGRFPSGILAERAANVLRKSGWDIQVEQTQAGKHVTQLARQAADEGMDGFFAVGGDGTINLAVRGLVGSQTALGVLPGGTANVFAQEMGLPGLSWTRIAALEESARRLANAPVHAMDVGVCGAIPFVLWAGIGMDAFVIHHIEPRERWEKSFAAVGYAASTVWHAAFWRGINLSVIADGEKISGHYLVAIISNIHLYAGGMAQISPNACLDDGLMDLWLFEGDTLGDAVQAAWDMLAGRHMESGLVRHVPFRSLYVESDSPLYVQVDAEPVTWDGRSIEITIQPHALRLMVPAQTPRPLFNSEQQNLGAGH
ncbi:MAG: diacylglycerol kinase family lipid kinase [Anaerolineales bacterium]|nr:diacylglycerol kinase family lipid kinase [Anaerolineales bacterium]